MQIDKPKSRQPLPGTAKKVFTGVLFDVYQWKQKMLDGSYEVFEKLVRPDTVQIIPVTSDGKIIVIEVIQPGKKSAIRVPSGQVNCGENVVEAAERELMEEAGYKSRKMNLWKAFQPISKIEWVIYTFIGKECFKVGKPAKDKGEKIIKLEKISFERFIDLVIHEKILGSELSLQFLQAYLNKKGIDKLERLLLT